MEHAPFLIEDFLRNTYEEAREKALAYLDFFRRKDQKLSNVVNVMQFLRRKLEAVSTSSSGLGFNVINSEKQKVHSLFKLMSDGLASGNFNDYIRGATALKELELAENPKERAIGEVDDELKTMLSLYFQDETFEGKPVQDVLDEFEDKDLQAKDVHLLMKMQLLYFNDIAMQRKEELIEQIRKLKSEQEKFQSDINLLKRDLSVLKEEISFQKKALEKKKEFKLSIGSVLCVLEISGGLVAISGGTNYNVLIYCAYEYKERHGLVGHQNSVWALIEKEQFLISGAHDKRLIFWNMLDSFKMTRAVDTGHVVYCLVNLPETDLFLEAGNSPYRIGVWTKSYETLTEKKVDQVISVLERLDHDLIGAGFFGGTIVVYRFQDLQFDPLFKVNRSGNVSSIVSLSNEEICSTSRDGGQVSIVSVKTGEVMYQTKLHDKDIIEGAKKQDNIIIDKWIPQKELLASP